MTRLLSRFQVKDLVATDDFKPNLAMVVLDFLIRHSFVEPDTGWCGVVRRCVQVSPSADVFTLCFSFQSRAIRNWLQDSTRRWSDEVSAACSRFRPALVLQLKAFTYQMCNELI